MSRWRPPAPKSAPYITVEGYRALEKEQSALWERRKDVTAALSAAAAEGDRSENAEYIYRKKELREIDRRIGYLQRRMPNLKVVDQVGDTEHVYFGAWVELEDLDESRRWYRIVGADEIGPQHYISMDSPLAKLLMRKAVGDCVEWRHGEIEHDYEIVSIAYGAQQPF